MKIIGKVWRRIWNWCGSCATCGECAVGRVIAALPEKDKEPSSASQRSKRTGR